mmetsp:Transcript_7049/g.13087  ORF Transcript_7049/g.13087 Transcript_7049/m.13087 type:complete len:204 (-) Transcript_7049:17-628(-)
MIGTRISTGCGRSSSRPNSSPMLPRLTKSNGALTAPSTRNTVRVPKAIVTSSFSERSGSVARRSPNVYRLNTGISPSTPTLLLLAAAVEEPVRPGTRRPTAWMKGNARALMAKIGSLSVREPTTPCTNSTACIVTVILQGARSGMQGASVQLAGFPSTTQILWPHLSCTAEQPAPTAEPSASGKQTPPTSAATAAAPMANDPW